MSNYEIKKKPKRLYLTRKKTKGIRYSVALFFSEVDFKSYNLFYRTVNKEIKLVDNNGWQK